jgi:hypothetical protein
MDESHPIDAKWQAYWKVAGNNIGPDGLVAADVKEAFEAGLRCCGQETGKEIWVCEKSVEVDRGSGLRINNPNSDGLPIAINIPANMIFLTDVILREMCYRGETSPELKLYLFIGGTELNRVMRWHCEWGAIRTWSVTPWGALEAMGRQVESLTAERDNG